MSKKPENKKEFYKALIMAAVILILVNISLMNTLFYESDTTNDSKEDIIRRGESNKIRIRGLEKGNGIITNIWLSDTEKLDRFKENNIRYLFVDVGDTNTQGKITTDRQDIQSFLDFVQEYELAKGYNFILLPYSETITKNYNILPKEFQKNYVDDYKELSDMGFDGILIDIEYITEENERAFIEIIDSLSENLPQSSIISAYAVGISENPSGWDWSHELFRKVSDRVDLIEFGTYDTWIKNEADYKAYVKNQLRILKFGGWNVNFMVVVPTHKEFPETISLALEAYNSEINSRESTQFIGEGIFAEWTTDEQEWMVFKKMTS